MHRKHAKHHINLCFAFLKEIKVSTPKRLLSCENISEKNPPKRHKANTTSNITNMNQQKLPHKEFISLSEKMKPSCFDDYIGQEKIIGPHTVLKQLLIKGHVPSMIFWGPPGCGKVIHIYKFSLLFSYY